MSPVDGFLAGLIILIIAGVVGAHGRRQYTLGYRDGLAATRSLVSTGRAAKETKR